MSSVACHTMLCVKIVTEVIEKENTCDQRGQVKNGNCAYLGIIFKLFLI